MLSVYYIVFYYFSISFLPVYRLVLWCWVFWTNRVYITLSRSCTADLFLIIIIINTETRKHLNNNQWQVQPEHYRLIYLGKIQKIQCNMLKIITLQLACSYWHTTCHTLQTIMTGPALTSVSVSSRASVARMWLPDSPVDQWRG